jgi:hypothetical protein
MSNFEQSPIGHRCSMWADVKELYGLRSFCSSGGAAVYSYTGKALLIHSLRHIYFLNGVHTESQVIRPAPARFFTLYLQSALARNARLLGSKELLPHETSRQIGTPALRAKIARDSLGTESRNEAGRTVIRNPCEESEFCQSQGNSRQGRIVCPFPHISETLPTVPKRPRIP